MQYVTVQKSKFCFKRVNQEFCITCTQVLFWSYLVNRHGLFWSHQKLVRQVLFGSYKTSVRKVLICRLEALVRRVLFCSIETLIRQVFRLETLIRKVFRLETLVRQVFRLETLVRQVLICSQETVLRPTLGDLDAEISHVRVTKFDLLQSDVVQVDIENVICTKVIKL